MPETTIEADPHLPTIRLVREFDAPPERVYRAWTDPDLFVQWIGPHSTETEIQEWEPVTGGHYRYSARTSTGYVAGFYGSFHELRPGERMVQTFTYDGYPDGVSLETMTFEALPGGRTRAVALSVVDSMEARDAMISSGMEVGVREGYEKLDSLLAVGTA